MCRASPKILTKPAALQIFRNYLLAGSSTALNLLLLILLLALPALGPATLGLGRLLEDRFPRRDSGQITLPVSVLVPGGGLNNFVVATAHGASPSGAGERITAAISIARAHPGTTVLLSGSGEADPIDVLKEAGLPAHRVLRETASKNTFENAIYAARLLHPRPRDRYVLITSALHMPRAIGAYRAAGFTVDAYPVDFRHGESPGVRWVIWREALGLVLYRVLGRSGELLPRP
jgi:uncharacterized SAM-binding protein YcdF (DUF218 family)